jgi:hypothetical protein
MAADLGQTRHRAEKIGVTCRGCGLANRMRSTPSTACGFEQTDEVTGWLVGRSVVVDDLAQELDPRAGRSRRRHGPRRECPPSGASAHGHAYGTTQKLQNSLHPSR